MNADDVIQSGGLTFDAAWLRCQAAITYKPSEALVRVEAKEVPEKKLAFLVDSKLIRSSQELAKADIDAEVKVMLISRGNGTAVVEVPGEPISYGPKVVVSSGDLAS